MPAGCDAPARAAGRRSQAGQAAVEFALVISLFLLLVMSTVELARAYLAYTVLANAAREAARYGAVHLGEASWDQAAADAGRNLAVGVDAASVQLTVSQVLVSGLPYVSVVGSYPFQPVTPLVGAVLGGSILLQVDTRELAG